MVRGGTRRLVADEGVEAESGAVRAEAQRATLVLHIAGATGVTVESDRLRGDGVTVRPDRLVAMLAPLRT